SRRRDAEPDPRGGLVTQAAATRAARAPHPLGWVPNALTVARLAALPVLLAVMLTVDGPTSPLAAWLFGGIAITDFVDGKLARALHAESRFGQVADPLADRLLMAVGLVGIILLGRLHWAGPAVILARDVLSIVAFAWYARRGVLLRVDMAGKTSSALAMVATGLALLVDAAWVDAVFWVAVAGSVLTLANYSRTMRSRPAHGAQEGASTRG
ncbi:MAG: CDP-alcohol phosphatidyltransferase family protein, partial [Actinomycetota bacterium]